MSDILGYFFSSIWWLIVALGILVTFHEYGHFWVARRCGVKVLRFSVGFGNALWSRVARNGTEYRIAMIPLGGYVKMLDGREQEVPPELASQSFNNKPVGQRIAIVAAGPIANLILAVALLWLMFIVGKPDYAPIVGRAEGIAEQAGFEKGDRLLAVGGQSTATWSDASIALTGAAMDRKLTEIRVQTASGNQIARQLPLDRSGLGIRDTQAVADIGLLPQHILLPPVVGTIKEEAAASGKLKIGDKILTIAGEQVDSFDRISPILQRNAKPSQPLDVIVERNGQQISVSITPDATKTDTGTTWLLGVGPGSYRAPSDALIKHDPLRAIPAAFVETWNVARNTMQMLWRMLIGAASLKNISGPISIAQYANITAQMGVGWFLFFLATLSVGLAILNLLPIPVLDGGHLLYYFIELIKGRPVSDQTAATGQYIGLALLASLMCLAFFNDIMRLAF